MQVLLNNRKVITVITCRLSHLLGIHDFNSAHIKQVTATFMHRYHLLRQSYKENDNYFFLIVHLYFV